MSHGQTTLFEIHRPLGPDGEKHALVIARLPELADRLAACIGVTTECSVAASEPFGDMVRVSPAHMAVWVCRKALGDYPTDQSHGIQDCTQPPMRFVHLADHPATS